MRWRCARAGKSVLGAFNVQHLETVAPVAERIIGYPIREIVPISFLRDADGVIALDVAVRARVAAAQRPHRAHRRRRPRAAGIFKPQNLQLLRELLLRTVDS
jgi:K+-sensing histidine kinase KdpD